MSLIPVTRVVLYKHGVGYFERDGEAEGDARLSLTFKQAEVSDVLKSLTVLDLDGGHIASVSYDSTKPIEQLLAEVALEVPNENSLVGLLPQLKGAKVTVQPPEEAKAEGIILGIDKTKVQSADGVEELVLLSLVTNGGEVRSFDLHGLTALTILDDGVRRDLDHYLRTQLSAKKKDARTFTFFARGSGKRRLHVSYTLEAPVWKATYRILLGEESQPPMIQGWAVVDNTGDEDWENVQLSLVAGLPVSFVHDLYTPRYIRRPVVAVQETTGVLPPTVEAGMDMMLMDAESEMSTRSLAMAAPQSANLSYSKRARGGTMRDSGYAEAAASSTPAQVRERKLGDLFEYEIEHPVTIRRNQSALVPIVLRSFKGRPVLLYNKATRAENPMRCVEFENTTGLTLEGGPVTVLEAGNYTGEAMMETTKPDEQRLIPYAVELGVRVLDNVESHRDRVYRVVFRRGQLKTWAWEVQQVSYNFDNKSDQEQPVYLDDPRFNAEWELFDTPKPHEITDNFWRFRFTLPAKKVTRFTVKKRQPLRQTIQIGDNLTEQQIGVWLHERYLDPKTERALREAARLRQEIALADEAIQRLSQERVRIHEEQKRIRENLQSLADRASEKELRERFVRNLNVQEDRLEGIEKEVQVQTSARDRARLQLDEHLAKLEYETEVAEK